MRPEFCFPGMRERTRKLGAFSVGCAVCLLPGGSFRFDAAGRGVGGEGPCPQGVKNPSKAREHLKIYSWIEKYETS